MSYTNSQVALRNYAALLHDKLGESERAEALYKRLLAVGTSAKSKVYHSSWCAHFSVCERVCMTLYKSLVAVGTSARSWSTSQFLMCSFLCERELWCVHFCVRESLYDVIQKSCCCCEKCQVLLLWEVPGGKVPHMHLRMHFCFCVALVVRISTHFVYSTHFV